MKKFLLLVVWGLVFSGCGRNGDDDHRGGSYLVIAASDFGGANALYAQPLDDRGRPDGDLMSRALAADPNLDPRLPSSANLGEGGPVLLRREYGSATGRGTLVWFMLRQGIDLDESMIVGASAGANPQDYLWINPFQAYVTRFDPAFDDLYIINPFTREGRGSIDLSGIAANADGLARPTRMVRADDRVYLLLQDINSSFTAYGPGKVAVINPRSNTIVDIITLACNNPQALLPAGGKLLVVSTGDWMDPATSGVEEIDRDTGAVSLLAAGDDPALDGFLSDGVLLGDTVYLLDTMSDFSSNEVVPVNVATGEVGASVYSSSYLTDLERDRFGRLLIADNAGSEVVVADPLTGTEVFAVSLAVPPQSVVEWR